MEHQTVCAALELVWLKQEVQNLQAFEARCKYAQNAGNSVNKSEYALMQTLKRELTIWGKNVAGTLNDAKLEMSQYTKSIKCHCCHCDR